MTETRRMFCGLCHPWCGARLWVEDGRAVKVEGDPDHPISRGRLCARGRLLVDHLYHPARLNYPLKRTGERGANQWQRLPWDQALDEVGERLASLRDQHGWWSPERSGAEPELFGVFESTANVLCPDGAKFCSPEIGSWPHSALPCRVEREAARRGH